MDVATRRRPETPGSGHERAFALDTVRGAGNEEIHRSWVQYRPAAGLMTPRGD